MTLNRLECTAERSYRNSTIIRCVYGRWPRSTSFDQSGGGTQQDSVLDKAQESLNEGLPQFNGSRNRYGMLNDHRSSGVAASVIFNVRFMLYRFGYLDTCPCY